MIRQIRVLTGVLLNLILLQVLIAPTVFGVGENSGKKVKRLWNLEILHATKVFLNTRNQLLFQMGLDKKDIQLPMTNLSVNLIDLNNKKLFEENFVHLNSKKKILNFLKELNLRLKERINSNRLKIKRHVWELWHEEKNRKTREDKFILSILKKKDREKFKELRSLLDTQIISYDYSYTYPTEVNLPPTLPMDAYIDGSMDSYPSDEKFSQSDEFDSLMYAKTTESKARGVVRGKIPILFKMDNCVAGSQECD